MDSYAFIPFLTACVTLACGLFVMIRAEQLLLSKAYFLVSLSAFCYAMMQFGLIQFAGTDHLLHLWVRLFVVPGFCLVPAMIYLLLRVSPTRTGLQSLLLLLSCVCSATAVQYWFPRTSLPMFSYIWGNAFTFDSLPYQVFLVNCGILLPVTMGIVFIQQRQPAAEPLVQRQRVILSACCILLGLGVLGTMLPSFGVALYPATLLLVAFGVMLGATALLYVRGLEPELIAYKILLTIMFILPLVAFQAVMTRLLVPWTGFLWASVVPAVIVFLTILLSPYRKWMEERVGVLVYRGKYNYQGILSELSQSLVAVVDLDHLADMIVTILVQTLGVEHAVLFLEDEREQIFRLRASSGVAAISRDGVSVSPATPLLQWLANERDLCVVAELRQQRTPQHIESFLSPVAQLQPEVIIPLFFKERLTGVLMLGKKSPAGIFNQGDIEVLRCFAQEAGVAIEHSRLYSEAIEDRTTGVFNTHYFIVRLREEVARSRRYGRPISLMLVDIDDFKTFEQTYSLHLGNVLLRDLGGRFKILLRGTDVLARYQASTFAVIVPETKTPDGAPPAEIIRKHIQDSLSIAERLRQVVEKLDVSKEEHSAGVSVSVGVAYFDGVNEKFSAAEFIQDAEQALYQARQEGGNRVRLREKR